MIEYKGYLIKPDRDVPTCYVVVTAGKGGKIPNVLDGLFTSPVYAKDAIDKYVFLRAKGKDNDKTISEG